MASVRGREGRHVDRVRRPVLSDRGERSSGFLASDRRSPRRGIAPLAEAGYDDTAAAAMLGYGARSRPSVDGRLRVH